MEKKSVGVLRVIARPILGLLLVISAAPVYAGDPVPGIDVIPGGKVKNVTTDETGALKSKFAIEKSSGSMHQTVVESGGKASEHENDANESRKSVIARQDKPQSK